MQHSTTNPIFLPIIVRSASIIERYQQIRSPDQTQTKAHKNIFQLLIYAESKGDGSTPPSPTSKGRYHPWRLAQHISSSSSDSLSKRRHSANIIQILLQYHHISYYRMHCISNIDNGDRYSCRYRHGHSPNSLWFWFAVRCLVLRSVGIRSKY